MDNGWKAEDELSAPADYAAAVRERNAWCDTAAQFARNEDYYRGLLDACALYLGPDVYVQDDGGVVDEPLRAKIPGLVERLVGLSMDRGRRQGLLLAATLARGHDVGENAEADAAMDALAEKLERLAGESG